MTRQLLALVAFAALGGCGAAGGQGRSPASCLLQRGAARTFNQTVPLREERDGTAVNFGPPPLDEGVAGAGALPGETARRDIPDALPGMQAVSELMPQANLSLQDGGLVAVLMQLQHRHMAAMDSLVQQAGALHNELHAAIGERLQQLSSGDVLGSDGLLWTLVVALFIVAGVVMLTLCLPSRQGVESYRSPESAGGTGKGPLSSRFPTPGTPVMVPASRRVANEAASGAPAPRTNGEALQARQQSLIPSMEEQEAGQLCPDLVVPEGSECTLLAPRLLESRAVAGGLTLEITDLRCAPVFKAVLGPPRGAYPTRLTSHSASTLPSRPTTREGMRISLESATEDRVFALARDAASWNGKHPGLEICYGNEQTFGQLCASAAEPGAYLATRRGSGPLRIQLESGPQHGALRVFEEASGTLLAIAEVARDSQEPQGPGKRSMRIGPMVDAGLVALLVLGVDWLELQARPLPAA